MTSRAPNLSLSSQVGLSSGGGDMLPSIDKRARVYQSEKERQRIPGQSTSKKAWGYHRSWHV